MSLTGRDLITMADLSNEEIGLLLDTAEQMAEAIGFDDPTTRQPIARLDRILATCFFEPSTRTRLSFESAMLRLGGGVLGFADPEMSSVKKGETISDTARIINGCADIMVIRHPCAGSAKVAADAASIPVINGGDGPHAHPTQTLTDLFCIRRRLGRLNDVTVGLYGDLRYGRTVHSLASTMARLGSRCVCIAPKELAMPRQYLDEMRELTGAEPLQVGELDQALAELDVLYCTRVQRERFASEEEHGKVAGVYITDAAVMARAPEHMIVLHPLPRVDEIHPEIDDDPRVCYFEQAAGGVPVRMALVAHLLGLVEPGRQGFAGFGAARRVRTQAPEGPPADEPGVPGAGGETVPASAVGKCRNDKCITGYERYLEGEFYKLPGDPPRYVCAYCEEALEG